MDKTSETMSEKRIMVTGGAGFIGSHLAEKLASMNNQVVVVDNLSSGYKENLSFNSGSIRFVRGDIRDLKFVKSISAGCAVIFHLAEFIPNFDQSPGHIIDFSRINPLSEFEVDVRGTLNILESARCINAKVIFASSAAVYGQSQRDRVGENDSADPVSIYGASKLAAEVYCRIYRKMYDLPIVVARLFNVYGPRQRKYIMYDILAKLTKDPNNLILWGTGNEERDFVYVDDVVTALFFLGAKDDLFEHTLNIGTGRPTSVRQLIHNMTKMLGLDPIVRYSGLSRRGDIKRLVADTARIEALELKLDYPLEEGLKNLICWYRESHKPADRVI